jgi:N-acetylmuramoyl-L-alanine amidase
MKVFISPSQQTANIGYGTYGSERTRMFEVGRALETILKRCGLIVYVATMGVSLEVAVAESNNAKADLHICLHSNALDGNTRGTLALYVSEEGNKLATSIYNKLSNFTPTNDLGIRKNEKLYELNNTNAIAAYIEIMFHDNKLDASLIMLNIEAIASLIARGICEYIKIPFVERTKPLPIIKYKVIAGVYTSRENAMKQVMDLKKEGFESFIQEVK